MKTKKNWRGGQSKDLIIYVLDENQEKQRGGGGLSSPGKKLKQKLVCLFLFLGRSFKLAKFH